MRKFAEEVQNELNRLPEDRADALLAAIHKNIPELHKELKKLPPASKKEAHTFSVSKVLQQKQAEGLVPRIAGLEHQADLAGLATMTAGVGDRLRSELVHKGDPNKGSVLGGEKGQIGTDVAGLAMMTAPTLAALASGQHDKWHHWANLGGLAALAAPAADELQARMRSAPGEDPHHRMMMSHDTHQKLHLLGYGALAAPVISNAAAGHGSPLSHGLTLAGYGTLAAPDLDEQIAKVRGKDPVLRSTLDKPGVRPAVDLAGLGLLGAGALTTKPPENLGAVLANARRAPPPPAAPMGASAFAQNLRTKGVTQGAATAAKAAPLATGVGHTTQNLLQGIRNRDATDTPADLKKKVDQRRFNAGDMRHYRLGQDTPAVVPGMKLAEAVTAKDSVPDRTAVLITGNPKYIKDNPHASTFYNAVEDLLKSEGFRVTRHDGAPHTKPPDADVWVGHSRGVDRFRFAPEGTKTIGLGAPGGINHHEDKAMQPGQVPTRAHFMLTPSMQRALRQSLTENAKTAAPEEVTDEKAQKALERIQMLEANRPSLKQLARWGAVSAGAGLVAGGVADVVRGKKPFGWAGPSRDAITQELITLTPKQQAWNVFRNVTADMGKGMVTSAAVPLINSQLDRNEQVEVLRDYVAQRQQRSTPPVVQTAPAAPVDPKVPPVVAQAAPSPLAKAASYLSKFAGVATTPAGRLAHTRAVGVTPNASAKGPSISEQSKPVGFGRPLAGTTKSTTGV